MAREIPEPENTLLDNFSEWLLGELRVRAAIADSVDKASKEMPKDIARSLAGATAFSSFARTRGYRLVKDDE